MNYLELMKKLESARAASGTDKMLVKVAVANDTEDLMAVGHPEPIAQVQTYTHLDIENVSVFDYHDSGEVNWVIYIKTKEQ